MTVNIDNLVLAAFISEIDGDEEYLVSANPVIKEKDASTIYYTRSLLWDSNGIYAASENDKRYFHHIDKSLNVPLKVGELVWLAGPKFISNLNTLSILNSEIFTAAQQFKAWPLYRDVKFAVGSREDYLAIASNLSTLLKTWIDTHFKNYKPDNKLFELAIKTYSKLPTEDGKKSREIFIRQAASAKIREDSYDTNFLEHWALLEGVFASKRDYRSSIASYLKEFGS